MTPANDDPLSLHDRQAKSITDAVAKLWIRFGPEGYTPEAIFEGAVKGAVVQLVAGTGCSAGAAAVMLEEIAAGLLDAERDEGGGKCRH